MNRQPNITLIIIVCCLIFGGVFEGALWAQFNPEAELDTDINPEDVIHWTPVSASGGSEVEVGLRLMTEGGFTLYSDKVTFRGPPGFELLSVNGPPTETLIDPISEKKVENYVGGDFRLRFRGSQAFQDSTFPVEVTYVGCTQVICLFPHTQRLNIPFYAGQESDNQDKKSTNVLSNTLMANSSEKADPPQEEEEDFRARWAQQFKDGELPVGLLVLLIFIGGLCSNLTPCVYPMIPITLRLLAGQGKSPITSAIFYAMGIVITYTSLGLFFGLGGGMFGVLMASTLVNLVFAALMAILGLTMLGFGDLSRLQAIGNRMGAGTPSFKNTLLMGVGAGLVAAPCTGPILAALLAYTAKTQDLLLSSSLLFTYSVGFALPYVFLGGAATRFAKIKLSHHVQIATKLMFSAVMFALALYYLRIPFYNHMATLKEYWDSIAMIAVSAGLVLTLLWVGFPQLQNNKLALTLPASVLAIGIFAASQHLTSSEPQLNWLKDEDKALALAVRDQKPILIDMWAEWCEACKKMDTSTFLDSGLKRELESSWIILKLDLTEDSEANDLIQEKYALQSLPTLVMLPPSGEIASKDLITGYLSGANLLKRLVTFREK